MSVLSKPLGEKDKARLEAEVARILSSARRLAMINWLLKCTEEALKQRMEAEAEAAASGSSDPSPPAPPKRKKKKKKRVGKKKF